MFKLKNNMTAGCNSTGRFAFNEDKLSYDEMVSSIIAALHAKISVNVFYDETCNTFPNAFDTRDICIGEINC